MKITIYLQPERRREKDIIADYFANDFSLQEIFHDRNIQRLTRIKPDVVFLDAQLYLDDTAELRNAILQIKSLKSSSKIILITNHKNHDLVQVKRIGIDDYLPISFCSWLKSSDFGGYVDILDNLKGSSSETAFLNILPLAWYKQERYSDTLFRKNTFYGDSRKRVSELDTSYTNVTHNAKLDGNAIGNMLEDLVYYYFNAIPGLRAQKGRHINQGQKDLIVRNESSDPFLMKCGRFFFVECKNRASKSKTEPIDALINRARQSYGNVQVVFLFNNFGLTELADLNVKRSSFGDVTLINIGFKDMKMLLNHNTQGQLLTNLKEFYTNYVFGTENINS